MSRKITASDIDALSRALSTDYPGIHSKKLINTLNRLRLTKQKFEVYGVLKVESWDSVIGNFWKHIKDSFK